MKITCPSCSAKYSIADEKVADRLAKIRCRKCGTTIVIDGKVDPANVYAADAAPDGSDAPSDADAGPAPGEYSVDFGDNDQRSMTLDQLVAAYNAGEVTADTYIWADGMDDWRPLGEVDSVVSALHAGAAAPAPAASAPLVSAPSSPFDTGASASPWANDGAPKAAASAGTADLFGGFDSAGSEEDVTTSAPPDEARGPAPAAAAATGARNESSVLFSLSALTSAAEQAPMGGGGGGGGLLGGGGPAKSSVKEDSGLIDLKALTSQSSSDKPADNPLMGSSPLGFGAPLGLGAPLGGMEPTVAPSAAPEPQAKSRSGIYIGGGIALAALVIAGAIVFASGGGKETPATPAAQPATTAENTAKPEETAAPAPTPTVTAEAPATGTAEAEKEAPKDEPTAAAAAPASKPASGGAVATKPKPASTGAAAKPTPTSSPAPAPKPTATTKPKPKKACNCPPGDLMCAMRCRAG
ncbi:MAG: zinc-ribbon domain-containing protein [Polyangiaceae bacterium]